MKTDFEARPVYLNRQDQILSTLQEMDFLKYEGKGYQPIYTRTELTDALHNAFDFCTSKQIVPITKMKKFVLKQKIDDVTCIHKAFIAAVKKYTDLQELDAAVLRAFIDRIEVSHVDKKSRTRAITIVYNFTGAFDFTRAIENARNTSKKRAKNGIAVKLHMRFSPMLPRPDAATG